MRQERYPYLSWLRVLGCLGVVVLHSFYGSIGSYGEGSTPMLLGMTVRSCMMWAVPVFVMVSGALLLDPEREITIGKVFKKYVMRMLLALLLCSVLFYLFDRYLVGSTTPPLEALLKVYTGGGWSHLWYLYLMIALYLLLPAYRPVAAYAEDKEIRYLLAVYTLFLCVLPLINTLTGTKAAFYICTYTVYPLYFFLGWALHSGSLRIHPAVAALLFLLGTALLGVGGYAAYLYAIAPLKKLLNNYAFLPVLMQSLGLFALVGNIDPRGSRFLEGLDRLTFGTYLLHMAALKAVLVVLGFDPYRYGGAPAVLGLCLAVFLVSLIVTWILKLIPGLKKLL